MKAFRAYAGANVLVSLLLFLTSIVACAFVADFWKDALSSAYAINQSPRVVDVRIEEYLGEFRHRYRRSTSILHEYRATGDGRQWQLRLPEQISPGSSVAITYAAQNPEIYVIGSHPGFFSSFTKIAGGISGIIFFGAGFGATALFGYAVFIDIRARRG